MCAPTSTWKAETGGCVFKASLDYIEKFCLRREQRDDGAESRGTREDRTRLRSSLSADSEGGWSQAIKASGDCAINMKAHGPAASQSEGYIVTRYTRDRVLSTVMVL